MGGRRLQGQLHRDTFLDRLAREGTRLERFYATPVSSPTRAARMTSREAAR